jgi:hypothetical protein
MARAAVIISSMPPADSDRINSASRLVILSMYANLKKYIDFRFLRKINLVQPDIQCDLHSIPQLLQCQYGWHHIPAPQSSAGKTLLASSPRQFYIVGISPSVRKNSAMM